jgi:diguanylate cyclase (GGDEF)-like protein/PAS domain S-box-containing protein
MPPGARWVGPEGAVGDGEGVRVASEQQAGFLAARVRSILAASSEAFVECDDRGHLTSWNRRAEALLGWSAEEVLGRPIVEVLAPARCQEAWEATLASLRPGDLATPQELRVRRRDGSELQVGVVGYVLEGPEGRLMGGFLRDLEADRAAEEALAQAYLHDSLTGLPNRTLFTYRLAYALARRGDQPGTVAVLVIDLDRFKAINEALGHEVGDEVLVAVAERLRRADGSAEIIARLGGDEFLVLFDQEDAELEAVAYAERALALLAQPLVLDGAEVFVTASIGVATTASSPAEATALLSNADSAMYQAKRQGGGAVSVFGHALRTAVLDRWTTEHGLHRALDRGELRVHYQPVVEVGSLRPVALEALVRWAHPEQGLVPPDRFVPVAEESGLIVPMGRVVLDEVCRQLQAWGGVPAGDRFGGDGAGGDGAGGERAGRGQSGVVPSGAGPLEGSGVVEVNLSARQIDHPELVPTVETVLAETGIPASWLTFEITESALMRDAARALVVLRALKDLGVSLAIDDFGTGYSSLSYLQRFPLDVVKVDRSFVADLGGSGGGQAIVGAVVGLAHSLGLAVVAEGVETEQQLMILEELGCDYAQGFLFARPRPADDLPADLVPRFGPGPVMLPAVLGSPAAR